MTRLPLGQTLIAMLVGYAGLSALTFLVYAVDKRAARRHARRVPEATLHLLALLGGWPGAAFAQQALRHKTRKQPFRRIFWLTVIVNCLVAAGFLLVVLG